MKSIICDALGPINQLRFDECPAPTAGAGQLLIDVKAIGVNFPDALLVQGLYQVKPATPFVPGFEFSGEVTAVGDGVSDFAVGDRIACVSERFGAFAEQTVVYAKNAVLIPDGMSYPDAATILCAHATAHHGLKQRARLQEGETLLVLGAAGGTGSAAVQIGKAMGARVIAACSTADKLAAAGANGADELINYRQQDLKSSLQALTGGRGVDVVYDPVGGSAFDASVSSMARNGRLLVVGFASGDIPSLRANLALVKEFSLIGVLWGSFVEHEPQQFADNMSELFDWYQQGKVSSVIDETLPLAEAATALTRVMERKVCGKLVLIP